jgi:DNA transformation protein and related proteins
MAVSREFRDFIEELLGSLAPVRIRPMFGGAGISADGMNFGLIIDDTLYLKVDDRNRAAFEAEGMSPFAYQAKGKPVTTSYWRVPDRLLEDPDEIADWARQALDAAKAKRH